MIPTTFPQANVKFVAPSDLDESQCGTIAGYRGTINDGNMDGQPVMVVAWQPTPEEREQLTQGASVFLMFCGGVPPHFVSTEFPL
jgi:hypothetical protein